MGAWNRFARRLSSVEEAPEPVRSALAAALNTAEGVRLLVLAPPYAGVRRFSPRTLLAITDRRWLVAMEQRGGGATVVNSDFANTLLVELTVILLYGLLRIEWAEAGHAQSARIEFNAVMHQLYREAIQLLVGEMTGQQQCACEDDACVNPKALVEKLPLKVRNGVLFNLLPGQHVRALVQRHAVYGRTLRFFQHELVPDGVLVLTDRELMILSEEKTWSWVRIGRQEKYGWIITYIPLSRVACCRMTNEGAVTTLEIETQATNGSSVLSFSYAAQQRQEIISLLEATTALRIAAGARAT